MARTNDLTQGSILGKLLTVAVPIMGTQLMQMAYNLTDMFWLGRTATQVTDVAASGMAGMFLWLSMAPMMVGRMGSEIGVSQSLGQGNEAAARGFAESAARISLVLGVLYGAILVFFTGIIIRPFGIQEPALHNATIVYLRIVGLGIPASFLSAAITGAFNGAGNSHLSFWCNAIGLVVNMILDPLMILFGGWGIAGAAVATVIAQMVVCLLFVLFVKKHPHRPFPEFRLFGRFVREKLRRIFKWSAPIAIESGLFTLLSMFVTAMITGYGESALAVQRVGSQIESLSWLVGGGFTSAVTSFMGQNFGAKRWDRIREGYRISLFGLLIWELMVTLLLFFFGRQLFSIFLSDQALLDMGGSFLKVLAFCQIFMAFEGASAGTFRGLGKTMPPSLCSIFSNVIRVPICMLLGRVLGLWGIWVGLTLTASLRGVMIWIWYLYWARSNVAAKAA